MTGCGFDANGLMNFLLQIVCEFNAVAQHDK